MRHDRTQDEINAYYEMSRLSSDRKEVVETIVELVVGTARDLNPNLLDYCNGGWGVCLYVGNQNQSQEIPFKSGDVIIYRPHSHGDPAYSTVYSLRCNMFMSFLAGSSLLPLPSHDRDDHEIQSKGMT